MSGPFNLRFYHGVPAVDSWKELFQSHNIVMMLPPNEFEEANRVIDDVEANVRFNVTIRWHESHYQGCIYQRWHDSLIAVEETEEMESER